MKNENDEKIREGVKKEIISYLKKRLPDMGIQTDNGAWGIIFEEIKKGRILDNIQID